MKFDETSKKSAYRKLSTFLGFLGVIDSLVFAFYLTTTFLAIPNNGEFHFYGQIGSGLIMLCMILLILGSYLIWKGREYKGGIINIGVGLLLCSVYIYFAFLITPQILGWLGPAGFSLFIPPMLSGLIGIASRDNKSSEISKTRN